MSDYISRADAIEAVQTYLNILINSRRHGDDFTFINVLTEIRNKISALPSADAVQGEWDSNQASESALTPERLSVIRRCRPRLKVEKGASNGNIFRKFIC